MLSTTCFKACRAQQVAKICRQLRTSAILRAEKTPIQKFGWEYIVRMENGPRPLSPHLTIYKPQLTWMMSGFERFTGGAIIGTLFLGGVGFAVLPIDFTTFVDFVRGLNLPSVITGTTKFIIAFPVVYYTLNGIRFLGYDFAIGTNLKSIYRTGKLVIALSVLISAAVALYSEANKPKTNQ